MTTDSRMLIVSRRPAARRMDRAIFAFRVIMGSLLSVDGELRAFQRVAPFAFRDDIEPQRRTLDARHFGPNPVHPPLVATRTYQLRSPFFHRFVFHAVCIEPGKLSGSMS